MSTVGQVNASRRPPELVIANSTPISSNLSRIASVVVLPTRDSQVLPAEFPQASVRGMKRVELPITMPRIGASWAVKASRSDCMPESGATPMSHGLWKSAVL